MDNSINFLEFKLFANIENIQHGITSRIGGYSTGTYKSLNLGYKSSDKTSLVKLNRELVASKFRVDSSSLLFPDQCHTNNVKCINTNKEEITETDALITDKKGIAIGVLAADCVPILFYDVKRNVIAAAHAGWRGTVKKIANSVLQKMKNNYGAKLEDILVGIGPCIQQNKYEVGFDVILEIEKLGENVYGKFLKTSEKSGHAYIDLQGINKKMLIETGIRSSNIEVMNLCTFSNPELFFSARRDGFQSGRFAAVIMLK